MDHGILDIIFQYMLEQDPFKLIVIFNEDLIVIKKSESSFIIYKGINLKLINNDLSIIKDYIMNNRWSSINATNGNNIQNVVGNEIVIPVDLIYSIIISILLSTIENFPPFRYIIIFDEYILFKEYDGLFTILKNELFELSSDIITITYYLINLKIISINIVIGNFIQNVKGILLTEIPDIIKEFGALGIHEDPLLEYNENDRCAFCLKKIKYDICENVSCVTPRHHYYHCKCIKEYIDSLPEGIMPKCLACEAPLNLYRVEKYYDAEEDIYHNCNFGKKVNNIIKDINYLKK
jgi:hypothetical protein